MSRTHAQIIEDAGGVTPVRQTLADEGFDMPDATVRSWPKRPEGWGSIPPEYWPVFVKLGWSTLEELASAAERRKFPDREPTLQPEAACARA